MGEDWNKWDAFKQWIASYKDAHVDKSKGSERDSERCADAIVSLLLVMIYYKKWTN